MLRVFGLLALAHAESIAPKYRRSLSRSNAMRAPLAIKALHVCYLFFCKPRCPSLTHALDATSALPAHQLCRNIDIALTARWPKTPIAAEAAEFLAEEGSGLFWSFAEGYVAPAAGSTDKAHLEAVEAVAGGLLSPLGLRLLRAFLSAHVFSPRVELWRQLAAAEAGESEGVAASSDGWVRSCGRVRSLGESPGEVASALAAEVLSERCSMPSTLEERETSDLVPLAVDHVHPGGGEAASAPMVVLSAPLGSTSFKAAHAELSKRATAGSITYIYRPLVRSASGSAGGEADEPTQTLQGYGVQLAIKNMEYKVLDDSKLADAGIEGDGEGGASGEGGEDDEEEVGGFLFGTMARRRPELSEKLKELKDTVAAAEGNAEGLKVWAMQDLGVQASSRVLSSAEPLKTLRDVCQNFPFTARTLSKLKVDRELANEVNHNQNTLYGPGFSGLFLNGLALPIAENDFFGLLQTIQREMHTVDALANLDLPSPTISKLVSLPPPTGSLRLEAGAHPAIVYLNDVEKDRKYQQFGKELREMTRMNMFGQMSFCRRNVLTMILVLDPATEMGDALLSYALSIMQQGAPVRFGLVLTPGASTASLKSARAGSSPYAPGSARLKALADVYESSEWAADAAAVKAEKAAKAPPEAVVGGDKVAAAIKALGGAGGGDGGDDSESARLGVLLTKAFVFLKRKGGRNAASKFLSAVFDARQSQMMSFFGGGGLEELEERHILEALASSMPASVKKAYPDAADLLSKLGSPGGIPEVDELARAGIRFLEEKGLGEVPCMLMNGVLTPLTHNYEREVMSALQMEHRFVTQLIQRRQLTDDVTDIASAIAKLGSAFPRYSPELLLPPDKIAMADLRPSPTLTGGAMSGGVAWVSAPPPDASEAAEQAAAAKAAKEEAKAERAAEKAQAAAYGYGDDEVMFGDDGIDGDDDADADGDDDNSIPSPTELHAVSHLLVLDACNAAHLAVAASALSALQTSPGGRARLGLLHNPSIASCAKPVAAKWAALAASAAAASSSGLAPLKTLIALAHAASLSDAGGGGGADSAMAAAVASSLLPSGDDAASAAVDLNAHAAYAASLGLSAGEGALVTNGRLVPLSTSGGVALDAVDVALLEEYEYRQRAEGAAKALSALSPPGGKAGGKAGGNAASAGGEAAWRTGVLMHTVVELVRVAQRATEQSGGGGNGRKVQLHADTLKCGAACVRIEGEGAGAAMELVAVLDPLSKQAQRLAPFLLELQSSLGLSVTLHLNPELSISEFPLENFYRYVVSLTPRFDAKGNSLAPSTDTAVFASLRTPQVLTLHVDAPEAWLIEVTEAAYDMDNIRLSELGERRTLSARYELVSLLITGSCEDLAGREPPAGLQLLLGRSGAGSHETDTLVMSNLGYFQLKAAPGLWQLSLAPGPSSEVYGISGEKSLMAAGHASKVARRLGAIDIKSLAFPLPALRLLVSDFSGFNALMFVQKRPGMQGVSLLSDDKQAEAAAGGGGGGGADGGADSSMLGSLSKWAFGGSSGLAASPDDEMVHVFSLASGHLYERFLKIMMQSVVDRTKRKVKFWLLKNFLSPAFMGFLPQMAQAVGFEYALVQYQWPSWLHKQTNKQRIIWGYKILFLDVMFPLHLKKIVYIDADQVVNADVAELWDMPLSGRAAVGMTPFCNKDANPDTTGFRFFAQGYWKDHLRGRPYHISALFVVDLVKFRKRGYGDQYRIFYDSLSKDPNSLANLDQDLPNYAQHVVPIHSLPESWLWCETWCGNKTKPSAKTIDLCNNPLTKEPKLNQAARIIGERWGRYDNRSREIEESEWGGRQTDEGAAAGRDEL